MKRVVRASTLMNRTRVVAAGEDEEMFDESYVDDYDNPREDLVDTLDDVSDAVDVFGILQPIRIRFDLLLLHLHFDHDFADDLLPLHDRRGEAVGEIGGQ